MAHGYDPSRPNDWVPIDSYNAICDWLEQNSGRARIRLAGVAVGDRAYERLKAVRTITDSSPLGMMEALRWAASTMIRDPRGRGWEILSNAGSRIVMRRTQTFNCSLQEGLLLSFLERTGVPAPRVEQERCVRLGDEYCEYALEWGEALVRRSP
jgi:hypothetical protein